MLSRSSRRHSAPGDEWNEFVIPSAVREAPDLAFFRISIFHFLFSIPLRHSPKLSMRFPRKVLLTQNISVTLFHSIASN
jgi:hypothetical protein